MIHNHIKEIVGYPKIVRESTTAIKQLSDTVQGHLRALRSLKEPVDHWDNLLIFFDRKSCIYAKGMRIRAAKNRGIAHRQYC